MCGVFAEFERAMIQERVKAGLARARNQGKGIEKIAQELKIGVSTVQRVVRMES